MKQRARCQSGFSLIEIVVGIVVSAIALTFLSTLFFSNAGRSVEPLLQVRAAEFGQALMDEILSKAFDENTPVGGVPACTTCSSPSNFDDGEAREAFDDVDDFNRYCTSTPPYQDLTDSLGNVISDDASDVLYRYSMSVCIGYDNDFDGSFDSGSPQNSPVAKLIIVDIYPTDGAGLGGSPITLAAYRTNF